MKTLSETGPIIVLLNGPKQSGKTTAAKILCSSYKNSYRAAFAEPLKEGVHASLGIDRPWDYWDEREDKDTPNDEFFGVSPRQAYINHSENYMKKFYGENIFAELMVNKIRNGMHRNSMKIIFIADCGFEIEYFHLQSKFSKTYVVQIHRPYHTFVNDSREYISYVEPSHFWVLENNSDLDNFELRVYAIMKEILAVDLKENKD